MKVSDPANHVSLQVNGQTVCIENVHPNTPLLDALRGRGLTGSKQGCAEGDCGACTLILLDQDHHGNRVYRSINSCIALLPAFHGREIWTVEGFAGPEGLHPVQEAMVRHYGSQCGYCTPGFTASLFEGYYRKDLQGKAGLCDQLCGNLCRCTGYRSIRDAGIEVLRTRPEPLQDGFTERLAPQSGGDPVALESIRYQAGGGTFHRPTNLKELFELRKALPKARLLAGATEIGVEINKKFLEVPALIAVDGVPELHELRKDDDHWHIGAGCTFTAIEEALQGEYPAMDQMIRLFASRQIRNRATMGGNLVTASPIGDSAPVLLALDAVVVVASETESRTVPLREFFMDYRKTALREGEILLSIRIPRADRLSGSTVFYKVSKRREMDISAVSAGFRVALDESGRVRDARLAFGGVAPTPLRVDAVEKLLLGRDLQESAPEVIRLLRETFQPISDVRASAAYRRTMVGRLWQKFVEEFPDRLHPAEPGFVEVGRWEGPDVSRDQVHESGRGHVTGKALYVEDIALRRPMLEMWPVRSPHAAARVKRIDVSKAVAMDGVHAVLTASDIPGSNNSSHSRHDEPLLAGEEVRFHGQIVAMVVGETKKICQAAARAVEIDYEPQAPILGIEAAREKNSWHTEPRTLQRGDLESGMAGVTHRLEGSLAIGGQDHFYLETQAAWAEWSEEGVYVASSTQHPSEVQTIVAEVLNLPRHQVVVEMPRMGGGFGGKESQANPWAALTALAAWKTGRPVRIQLDRDLDMQCTGKRHPFLAEFEAGFDDNGRIQAVRVDLFSDGGWSLDLSMPVMDRALFHLDNAYYLPNLRFTGRVAKTNVTSQTAFRGFGGPQGMLVIEEVMARVARHLGLPPEEVRRANFYHGQGDTNTTHYGQEIEENRLERIWTSLLETSEFIERRRAIDQWNAEQSGRRRGLAITPVKFGISFTLKYYNQAGALVLVYQDGSVQVNHGGTEMGQGLHTKILGVAMREFGLPSESIRLMHTRTDKVPNTSATAASAGSDLNGAAVANACAQIKERLAPLAADLLSSKTGREVRPENLVWRAGRIDPDPQAPPEAGIPFAELVMKAYQARISLAAFGYYRTPRLHWDWAVGKGTPFHYFAFGAAVTEVEIDIYTGQHQIRRVDILHDVGDSLNPGVDRGQIEGGFVQGTGWLTSEEVLWNEKGVLLSHSASTYQIPAISDVPMDFRVTLLDRAAQARTIGGSKAVGEPPLMLAISVREALRDAVAAARQTPDIFDLPLPSTPEGVVRALEIF